MSSMRFFRWLELFAAALKNFTLNDETSRPRAADGIVLAALTRADLSES